MKEYDELRFKTEHSNALRCMKAVEDLSHAGKQQ